MITTVTDYKRGCGYRKPGGLYLMAGKPERSCCKLPHILTTCPVCGGGIKPARGWTWFDPRPFFRRTRCTDWIYPCILQTDKLPERAGLVWVGSKFYPTPGDYLKEAQEQGISRRLPAIPRDFEVGETWVFLAHRDIPQPCPECDGESSSGRSGYCDTCGSTGYVQLPGIFSVFKPERIEYVVKGDETDEDIERMERRGITPVRVERADDLEGLMNR